MNTPKRNILFMHILFSCIILGASTVLAQTKNWRNSKVPLQQLKEYTWFNSSLPESFPGKNDGVKEELERQKIMKAPDASEEVAVVSILNTVPGIVTGSFFTTCVDRRTIPESVFSRCVAVAFDKLKDQKAAASVLEDLHQLFRGTIVVTYTNEVVM